jgi:hypothetical protein
MTSNIYISQEELKSLADIVSGRFNAPDPQSGDLFKSLLQSYLICNYSYITEPTIFDHFIKKINSDGVYIGRIFWNSSTSRCEPEDVIFVSKNATSVDISERFNVPGITGDPPLQTYVAAGFLLPRRGSWQVWFSTKWELAIIGFVSPVEALEFASINNHIEFMKSEWVVEQYENSPSSAAIKALIPYLERNVLK